MTTVPTPLAIGGRLGRLRAALADAGLDALVVTRLPNVRWLTGFTGSAATVVVAADDAVLVTDGRYRDQSAAQIEAAGVDARVALGAAAADQRRLVAEAVAGRGRVGLEEHGVTWAQQRAFVAAFDDAEVVPAGTVVEDLRRVKDPGEVERIRAACEIADAAFAAVLGRFATGPTERELALELELEMRRRGASGTSFDPIVASGPNGALPHARPGDRRIGRGELVVCDFGCVVDGYCSDMTRTVSVGDPGPAARRLYDVVLRSQRAGRDAVAPGVGCAAIDAVCRRVVAEEGLGEAFLHSTGHGVGLEIHEDPRLASTSRATLQPGDVVTVEPGVYLPGVGGVRIEDTVVVTASGADALTRTEKVLVL